MLQDEPGDQVMARHSHGAYRHGPWRRRHHFWQAQGVGSQASVTGELEQDAFNAATRNIRDEIVFPVVAIQLAGQFHHDIVNFQVGVLAVA